MTDREIAELLGAADPGDGVGFRVRVIEQIYRGQQRVAALRHAASLTVVYSLVGLACALLAQSEASRSLLEPIAASAFLCAAAGELAAWLIDGRSLISGRFR
jgi:hypothetical protein